MTSLAPLSCTLLILSLLASGPSLAQGNQGAQNLSQSNRSGQSQQGGKAQTAQVGAGTTNGTTTGYSGPKDSAEAKPGEVQVPPLPSPELCQFYQNSPAYQACLLKVLGP